jgi:CHAT domain-containing protein
VKVTDRSIIVSATHRCEAGHNSDVATWVVVDRDARPDLLALVREKQLRRVRCDTCGRTDLRTQPLIVLIRRREAPPVGLFIPGRGQQRVEIPWFENVDWRGLEGGEPRFVPTSFKAAAVAVSRCVTADLSDPDVCISDVRRVFGRRAAADYRNLLRTIVAVDTASDRMERIGEATTAATAAAFRAIIADHPELLEAETLELLAQEYAADADVRLDLGRRLLEEARADPEAAWTAHHKRLQQLGEQLTKTAGEWERRLEAAHNDPDLLVNEADAALEYAAEVSADEEFVAMALQARAHGRLRSDQGLLAERVAAAVADYDAVLQLTANDHPGRAHRLLNAAVATGQQVTGDPRAHFRRARDLLEEGLELVDEHAEPELAAMMRTNLAQALVRLARDDLVVLRRARALCDKALEYRSPDRNAEDWAYTMINLGTALEGLAAAGEVDRGQARRAYEAVIDWRTGISGELVAHARMNLLSLGLDEAEADADDGEGEDDTRYVALEEPARQVADDKNASPVTRGRAMRRLGAMLRHRGEVEAARTALEDAVLLLRGADLREHLQAAWDLAALLSDADEWLAAAPAYRDALAAADLLTAGPRAATDRVEQAASVNRLSRWAAHSFVMTGAFEEAVIALENGRTRELRRQLQLENPELEELAALVPEAVASWRDASSALTDPSTDLDAAGQSLDDSLARIRAVPGFERFGMGANVTEIRRAAESQFPVVYINPSPYGTALLRVGADGDVVHRELAVTSTEVAFRVLFGVDALAEVPAQHEPLSYALAAAGDPSEIDQGVDLPDLADALDRLLPWVGDQIAAHVDALLSSHRDRGALLIACGPLATVPLVAATYGPDHASCLLDKFAISATPSATAHAAARRRGATSANETFRRLVAIADPTHDLEYTNTEIEQVRTHFDDTVVAHGDDATIDWLRERAGDGTALHLACHAYAGMLDATASGFILADGDLRAPDVSRLGPLHARVAVASACQSGVTELSDLADEAFSLGTALLAAGAACAIASLWSVNDLATAMLMTRLYDAMADGMSPPTALATAQRWVRDLDQAGYEDFLRRHPRLRDHATRSRDARRMLARGETQRPFAHPEFWAAFVALGA